MQAQQRSEANALQRLVMNATRLSIEQLVAIVDMNTEVPEIVCPHCSRGLSTGSELRRALCEMKAGARPRHCTHPGKPLKEDDEDLS